MKDFKEYILEGNIISESFLDNIKDAIKKITSAPEKYIKIANDKLSDLKDHSKFYAEYYSDIDPDEYSKMLDSLNNDETINHIYKYGKKKINFGGSYRSYLLEKKTDPETMDKVYKDIDKEFKCNGEKSKIKAILDILNALMIEYWDLKDKQSSNGNSSYKSSSHSSSSNVARYTAIAATVAMRRR